MNGKQLALDACDGALKNGVTELTKIYIAATELGGNTEEAVRRFKAGLEALKSGYAASRELVGQAFSEGAPAS